MLEVLLLPHSTVSVMAVPRRLVQPAARQAGAGRGVQAGSVGHGGKAEGGRHPLRARSIPYAGTSPLLCSLVLFQVGQLGAQVGKCSL